MEAENRAGGGAPARVFVVDDHALVSDSLVLLLRGEPDLACVGVSTTLADALVRVPAAQPDVLVLDDRLPDGSGVEAVAAFGRADRRLRILVLAEVPDVAQVRASLAAGACGFLTKRRGLNEVTTTIRSVLAGETVVSPDLLRDFLAQDPEGVGRAEAVRVTARERELLLLLGEGLSNAAIAERLVLSVYTVRNAVARLSRKVGAHSKLELFSKAISLGLIDPPAP